MKPKYLIILIGLFTFLLAGYWYLNRDTKSNSSYVPKSERATVEKYFIENMRVTPEEAKEMASKGVDLRLSTNSTLQGVLGNLYYYGYIDDEEKFLKLLKNTPDTTAGREKAIIVGDKSIDTNSNYYLNYNMTEPEIADTLLNKGLYSANFTEYTYLFMPSGPHGPTRAPQDTN